MRRSPQQLHHFKASEIQAVNFGAEVLRGGSRAGQYYSGWICSSSTRTARTSPTTKYCRSFRRKGETRSFKKMWFEPWRRLQFFFFCFYSWKADRDNLVIICLPICTTPNPLFTSPDQHWSHCYTPESWLLHSSDRRLRVYCTTKLHHITWT